MSKAEQSDEQTTDAGRRLREVREEWFNLSDAAAEGALYDSVSMSRFIGLNLSRKRTPDGTTICRFHHLLERNKRGEALIE